METQKKNMCRCCASEGAFKDVKSVYHWMGEEEVYADMLRDCLDISLNTDTTGEVEGGICEACITQLRNATSFKRQVLHTEEKFIQMISNNYIWVEIKEEPMDAESTPSNSEISVKQSNEEDYSVSGTYIAAEEVQSSSELTNVNHIKPPERKHENSITDEAERNLKKENSISTKIITTSNVNSDETAINTQDNGTDLKAASSMLIHVCSICNYTTDNASILEFHMNSHSSESYHKDEKPFACEICEKKYIHKGDLKRHILIHSGENPYACEMCDRKFTRKSSLNRHIRIHTGEKPCICEICEKKFTLKSTLEQHIKTHTGKKPYSCELCNQKFARKHYLEKHIKIHTSIRIQTGENSYTCEICDKKFVQKGDLKRHIRIHTGDNPYVCETCDEKFALKGTLENHIKRHTGEKPYACDICDKKFIQKGDLKRHIRIHTGERPYACETCDKKFTLKCTLEKHIRIHTGIEIHAAEKPYACETCDRKFAQKGALKQHIRRHARKNPCD